MVGDVVDRLEEAGREFKSGIPLVGESIPTGWYGDFQGEVRQFTSFRVEDGVTCLVVL